MPSKDFSKRLHAVIFDLDGTLVDSEVLWTKAMSVMIKDFGKTYDPAFQKNIMGTPGLVASALLKTEYDLPASVEEIDRRHDESYAEVIKDHLPDPKPGADRLLRELHAAAVPIALATSADRDVAERILVNLGWRSFFREIVVGADVKNGKPAPDIYLEAARRMGCVARSCVAFEDSPNGVRSAASAGLVVVGVKDTRYVSELPGATLVITSLEEMSLERLREIIAHELKTHVK